MRIYKIVGDVVRCFMISCAVTLLLFFFYKPLLFTEASVRIVVGGLFVFFLVLFAGYVLFLEPSRYKVDGAPVMVESMGCAVSTNASVADYNKNISSTHEAGHAVMSYLKKLEQHDTVVTDTEPHVVSVYKAMNAADIRNYIMVLYAGAAAEELFYGIFHSGVAFSDRSDFKRAVEFMKIYLMMTHSDISKACLDEEVSVYIKELSNNIYNETSELLSQNKHMVETIAEALKEKGSLTTGRIRELLEPLEKRTEL